MWLKWDPMYYIIRDVKPGAVTLNAADINGGEIDFWFVDINNINNHLIVSAICTLPGHLHPPPTGSHTPKMRGSDPKHGPPGGHCAI